MTPDLNIVLEAAMHLPLEEQAELIKRLSLARQTKKKAGVLRKHFGTHDSGDTRSADNDKIDADLTREYASDHEFEN